MKRPLTYEEVLSVIDMEDQCGVNQTLQEIFSFGDKLILGKDIEVIGEFNNKNELGAIEVQLKK
jgi:hypothetical protein